MAHLFTTKLMSVDLEVVAMLVWKCKPIISALVRVCASYIHGPCIIRSCRASCLGWFQENLKGHMYDLIRPPRGLSSGQSLQ